MKSARAFVVRRELETRMSVFFLNEMSSREEKEVFLWVFCGQNENAFQQKRLLSFSVFLMFSKKEGKQQQQHRLSSHQTHRILSV